MSFTFYSILFNGIQNSNFKNLKFTLPDSKDWVDFLVSEPNSQKATNLRMRIYKLKALDLISDLSKDELKKFFPNLDYEAFMTDLNKREYLCQVIQNDEFSNYLIALENYAVRPHPYDMYQNRVQINFKTKTRSCRTKGVVFISQKENLFSLRKRMAFIYVLDTDHLVWTLTAIKYLDVWEYFKFYLTRNRIL